MKPKDKMSTLEVGVELESFLDQTHPLYQLANRLNWDYLVAPEIFIKQNKFVPFL